MLSTTDVAILTLDVTSSWEKVEVVGFMEYRERYMRQLPVRGCSSRDCLAAVLLKMECSVGSWYWRNSWSPVRSENESKDPSERGGKEREDNVCQNIRIQ